MVNHAKLAKEIGANSPRPVLTILFIPTLDRLGKPLKDADSWKNAAMELCSKLFGGATLMAPAYGTWFNPETESIVKEEVHLLHAYSDPGESLEAFEQIGEFLHRMGRETNQGEVVLVVDGVMHGISKYRKAKR